MERLPFNLPTMRFCLLIWLLAISLNLSAQHENDNWCFGDHAAVKFNGTGPVNLTNSAMYAVEGCSSVSDSIGNLLFYTNGITVYNANNQPMPNGDSLFAHLSSTQAALSVRAPGNPNQYYVFTTDFSEGTHGLCYSIVDMTLDGGLGDVSVKNVLLLNPSDEKLTAVINSTGDGYWIVAHQQPISYYAFQLTSSGIGSPVISTVGTVNNTNYPETGSMKLSPDGEIIVNTLQYAFSVDIAQFDNASGVVFNLFGCAMPNRAYGVEFSPSGKRLYVCNGYDTPHRLYQMNLETFDSASVVSSLQLIYAGPVRRGALQLAPDGKIYAAHYNKPFLGIINSPDSLGFLCNYVDTGFFLDTICFAGLPNCISGPMVGSYAQPQAQIPNKNFFICPDSCISFGNQSTDATSYEWFFQAGNPSYSTDQFPSNICYSAAGNFDVTLIAHNGPLADTVTSSELIQVYPPILVTVVQSNDTLFAINAPVGTNYQWKFYNDVIAGATEDFYVPTSNGIFSVIATGTTGCSNIFSYNVTTIGIDEVNESTFQLFPNPADEFVTVTLNHPGELKLYNTLGQLIQNGWVVTTETLDVSILPAGVYYVSVRTENDLALKRLVVIH